MSVNLSEQVFNLPLTYYLSLDNNLSETVYAYIFDMEGNLFSKVNLTTGSNEIDVPHKVPYTVLVMKSNGKLIKSIRKLIPLSR